MREACTRVLADTPHEALQYAASEGFAPLREWVAAELARAGHGASTPAQVLITTGSQQGLDLVGKVLIDAGSRVAVEAPTYLGALQAFAPYEPEFVDRRLRRRGPAADRRWPQAQGARFLYLLPNFQNPSGRSIGAARRAELVRAGAAPAACRWSRTTRTASSGTTRRRRRRSAPPPATARIYLGSFSKVLAPGLRLGYLVAPKALFRKLLQAKQAADLHTPGFNQRIAHEVMRSGLLAQHLPQVRARYKARRDAMGVALERTMPRRLPLERARRRHVLLGRTAGALDADRAAAAGCRGRRGLRAGRRRSSAHGGARNTLRLSFVTVPPERDRGRHRRAGRRAQARHARHCRHRRPAMKRRFHQLDVFSAHAAARQPAGGGARRERPGRRTDGGLRALDEPVGDHLPAAAHRCRRRLPRAHLHAGRRAALRRPPDAGQLPRLAGCRRRAARRTAWWCSSAASAWCACAATARGWPSPRRRCAAAARSTRPTVAQHPRGTGAAGAGACAPAQWVDNGPGWCALLLDSAARVLAVKPDWRRARRPEAGPGRRPSGGRRRAVRGARLDRRRRLRRPGHRQPQRQHRAVADRRRHRAGALRGGAGRGAAARRARAHRVATATTVWVGGDVGVCIEGEVEL